MVVQEDTFVDEDGQEEDQHHAQPNEGGIALAGARIAVVDMQAEGGNPFSGLMGLADSEVSKGVSSRPANRFCSLAWDSPWRTK